MKNTQFQTLSTDELATIEGGHSKAYNLGKSLKNGAVLVGSALALGLAIGL